jgi:hypothetical protein
MWKRRGSVNGGRVPWWGWPETAGAIHRSARQRDQDLSERIVALAHERRRFGYRRIADLVRAEGTPVNDKRVYRLYRLEDLAVRKRRGKKRSEARARAAARVSNDQRGLEPGLRQRQPGQWPADQGAGRHRRLQPRVASALSVDYGMGGEYVIRLLAEAARFRGYPKAVRTDQGPRVHEPCVPGVGDKQANQAHPEPTGQAHAECRASTESSETSA